MPAKGKKINLLLFMARGMNIPPARISEFFEAR
jgi:hypothetical protein